MTSLRLPRRRFLLGAFGLTGASLLSGCDAIVENDKVDNAVQATEAALTKGAQRLILSHGQLAHEFSEKDISPVFKVNGTEEPPGDAYAQLAARHFLDWRLAVDGEVEKPLSLSLADLKSMPARTQITRHDCVEGWSAIGKWTGTPLAQVLRAARPTPRARYAVFHCADDFDDGSGTPSRYYESIDLVDAYHPQTILAYGMNDADLSIGHGAPIRLRVERQLGYKQAKYVMRIELVDSFARIHGGRGGFWEDRGYEWYAGI